jgi:integrase
MWKVHQMARKANGQGHTYKVGSSYRTVIRQGGTVVTAMAKTPQQSKSRAKAKISKEPQDQSSLTGNPKLKVEEFLLHWLDETHQHQIAHSTYRRYRSLAVHHIIPFLGHQELRKLNSQMITKFLVHMRSIGQSVRSQQQARALLAVALGEAENTNLISINPVRKVRNPQGAGKALTPLKIEEVKRLLKTYQGTFHSARLHLSLICGLRQGEALGLRWQDIDFESGTLTVSSQIQMVNGKATFTRLKTNRSYRTLVLTEETLESLRIHKNLIGKWQTSCNDKWVNLNLVFPGDDGAARSSHIDYNEWQKALKLCGIEPHRLHDARHTAATLMYSQGIGIETISRVLGHSSSAVTSRIYIHASQEPLAIAALKLNDLITSFDENQEAH